MSNEEELTCAGCQNPIVEQEYMCCRNTEERAVDIDNLKTANDELRTRVEDQSQTIATYEARLKVLEEARIDGGQPQRTDLTLEERLNIQSQALLRNDVEISGLTEKPAENPHHLFLTVAALTGMKLADHDVDFVTRTGPLRTKQNDPPRPLVVRFCRRQTRDQFYSTAKSRRLTTKDLEIEGPSQNIYINDRLTRENRQLFRECRTRFKEAGYKFCWTKWCQILVKKREGRGEESKAFPVKSIKDIDNILNKTAPTPD
ncbi:uncharacterized protein LOC134658976 [Cydia amplana]|uniref:uncharacterized protein LOC134658976 n=1 Tax=Cydia amplana TaxID=1869771 RepID=UPI002FE5CA31